MKTFKPTERTCPYCGKIYTEHPAVSRCDDKTLICPGCGTREALDSIGVKPEEQEKILNTIREHTNRS